VPSVVHFYPAENPPQSRVGRFLHARQGWWFFPLLLLEALNLHWQSVHALITNPTLKRRRTELALLVARWGGYAVVLFVFLSPGFAAAFLLVQLAVMGVYLGSSFAASHIGMPILPPESRVDFLRRQVLMSRNVKGGRVASFAMGGLTVEAIAQSANTTSSGRPIPSDRRLKTGIARVGTHPGGFGLYRFRYLWSDAEYVGVMAQEVLAVRPDAVTRGRDGYLRVFYDRLGIPFQSYARWLASGAHIPTSMVQP